jgi:hypothetical protein
MKISTHCGDRFYAKKTVTATAIAGSLGCLNRVLNFGSFERTLVPRTANLLTAYTRKQLQHISVQLDNSDNYFSIMLGKEPFISRAISIYVGFEDEPIANHITLFNGVISEISVLSILTIEADEKSSNSPTNVALDDVYHCVRASRYSDPLNPADILPIVYGDFTVEDILTIVDSACVEGDGSYDLIFTGTCTTPATGTYVIVSNVITAVELTSPGTGYTTSPTVATQSGDGSIIASFRMEGGWVLPCIDKKTFVYCFNLVPSVAVQDIAVYADGVLVAPASYTFNPENSAFDLSLYQAPATVTFTSDQETKVITAYGKGKVTAGVLLDNIIDIVNDFLTVQNDFTSSLFESTKKTMATRQSSRYKAAGVINEDGKIWDIITSMMASFLGSAYLDGNGKLCLEIDDGSTTAFTIGIPTTISKQETTLIGATLKIANIINQCPMDFGYNYVKGAYHQHTDLATQIDTASQGIYGVRKA